jgi:hypothetical protein
MKTLLINPPLAQSAGPYPAIAYLAGFLRSIGREAALADASLNVLLRLFSRAGVEDIAAAISAAGVSQDPRVRAFVKHAEQYAAIIGTAVACLQGRDHGARARALQPGYFPEPLDANAVWATRSYYSVHSVEAQIGTLSGDQRARLLTSKTPLRAAFGTSSETDEAQFRASTVLSDLAAVIRIALEPEFELDAYAERLSDECASFDPLRRRLEGDPSLLDRHIDAVATALFHEHEPDVVGLSVPFAGTVYGALRLARQFKVIRPGTQVVIGGGWINTQLRELSDPAVFDYVDFITLDDGERPLACVLELLEQRRQPDQLCRTFVRKHGAVVWVNDPREKDVPWSQAGTPTYAGLPLDRYLSYRPTVQAFQKFWGTRWNKLTLAHGCYWNKCAFCDTGLDYINRYEQMPIDVLIDRIKALIDETGETGFHFVDEAMPPALMRKLAERLIAEQLSIAWWGNARFDRALEDMGPLLAASGCVAITGGLETASERTLALMEKGVPLAQGVRVCHGLARAGIFVHAYLIYGFPTETAQETVDALECVRQMFAAGALHSAMWHYFGLTKYSPIARVPERFGITLRPPVTHPFSNYLLEFDEPGRIDHEAFGEGLRRAASQFRLGIGLARPAHAWFTGIPMAMPQTTLPSDFVATAIARA